MNQLTTVESTRLERALNELKDEVRQLREVLVGNAEFEQEGLVKLVRKHDKFINAVTSRWSVLVTVVIVCWTVFATIHFGK